MTIRRVVTGHDEDGKSVFIMDGPAPNVVSRGTTAVTVTELWETGCTPADNSGAEETTNRPFRIPPPPNGSIFRIVEYPPDSRRLAALQGPEAAAHANRDGVFARPARHPGFHKTDTIDYAIVLSGEIYALMDEGEVQLKAGDTLIQRGTHHAWSNRSDQPARVAFVLIDARPAGGQPT